MSSARCQVPWPVKCQSANLGTLALGYQFFLATPLLTAKVTGPNSKCRVGKCRGGVGVPYQFSGPFVCRCLTSYTVLRLHFPLIEPDVQVYRIRLSDKDLMRSHTRVGAVVAAVEGDPAYRAGNGHRSVSTSTPALYTSAPTTVGAYGKRGLSPCDRPS